MLKRAFAIMIAIVLLAMAIATSQAVTSEFATANASESTELARQLEAEGHLNLSVTVATQFRGPATATIGHELAAYGVVVMAVFDRVGALEVVVDNADALAAVETHPSIEAVVVPPFRAVMSDLGGTSYLVDTRTSIESSQFHAQGIRGAGVGVAIIDAGVDLANPDVVTSVVYGRCFQSFGAQSFHAACPDGEPFQSGLDSVQNTQSDHGTTLAHTVTGDGGLYPLGMAPDAAIEVYRVSSNTDVDLRDVLVALNHILVERFDVDIIVLSLGSTSIFTGVCSRQLWPAFSDTVRALRDRGVFVTASAGNVDFGSPAGDGIQFPACLESVHAVAALGTTGELLAATRLSSEVDLAARGIAVTRVSAAGVSATSGSSFANSTTAGCAALFIESGIGDLDQLAAVLKNSTRMVSRHGFALATLYCAPLCEGRQATVNYALGESSTTFDDVVLGSEQADEIWLLDGDDVACGGGGSDLVVGGRGNDVIIGQEGDDRLFGNFGNDVLWGGEGEDTLHGSAGDDMLYGQQASDRLFGYSGNDYLSGGLGDDRLHGNTGDDALVGNFGDDRLFGYLGNDQLNGGAGSDRCFGNDGINSILSCGAPY